jgi:hypothetical protein
MGEKTDVTDWISSLPAWQQDLVCRVADTVELEPRIGQRDVNEISYSTVSSDCRDYFLWLFLRGWNHRGL